MNQQKENKKRMEGWKEYKLGEHIHIKHGYAFKGEYFTEVKNENILLTPGNFKIGGGFKDDKLKFYNGPIPNDYVLNTGDVIITMTDLSKMADTLGYSAKVPSNQNKLYLHNQRIGLVEFKNDFFDKDFIYWLMRIPPYQRFVAGSATGATVKHTSPNKIYAFKFKAPKSKDTQHKIAKILSAYDDLIENNLKRINLLEEMARITYEEWFVRMKFPGHEHAKFDKETGLPEGWKKVKIKNFVDTSSGGTPSRKKLSEYYENGTIPWIKTGELRKFLLVESEEKITELGLQKSSAKIYPSKTVLLAMYGNTIGEASFLSFEAATNQACCAFLTDGKDYISYFLHQFFLNSKDYVLGFRMGAAQENISQQLIKSMKLNVPKDSILQEFGKIMEEYYHLIINLQNQNQHLTEARDILLPRLMTGMVDVAELEGKVMN